MAVSPFLSSKNEPVSALHADAKKLSIVCIGAHPGDPEFGCGGTMAKYANAGHSVTFLYLTRGEAGDPTKSYAESAAIRTKEAENACKILHAKNRLSSLNNHRKLSPNSLYPAKWIPLCPQ